MSSPRVRFVLLGTLDKKLKKSGKDFSHTMFKDNNHT